MQMTLSREQRGLTLLEILLVVAIIVMLAAITIPIETSVLTRQYLSDAENNLQTALRTANLNAKLGTYNLGSGVWIDDASKAIDGKQTVVLYRGSNYESRNKDLDEPIEIPANITIAATPTNDIRFNLLTGMVERDTIIKISNATGEKTLRVNIAGTVSEDNNAQLPPATQ